jgi:hypothetical protein
MQLILSRRSSFSAKQQARFDEWSPVVRRADASDLVRSVRKRFFELDPFADMRLAPFRIEGLKQSHLHPNKKGDTSASAATSTAEDVPFAFLPRSACSKCGRTQPFYCTYCYIVVHEKAKDKVS